MLQPNVVNNSTLNRLQGLVRILVIHNVPAEAKQLVNDLNANGIKSEWTETVDEAVKKIRIGHFDAVLLNTSFKEGSAIESIRAIRMQSRNLPIVVLSDNDDKVMALEH